MYALDDIVETILPKNRSEKLCEQFMSCLSFISYLYFLWVRLCYIIFGYQMDHCSFCWHLNTFFDIKCLKAVCSTAKPSLLRADFIKTLYFSYYIFKRSSVEIYIKLVFVQTLPLNCLRGVWQNDVVLNLPMLYCVAHIYLNE